MEGLGEVVWSLNCPADHERKGLLVALPSWRRGRQASSPGVPTCRPMDGPGPRRDRPVRCRLFGCRWWKR